MAAEFEAIEHWNALYLERLLLGVAGGLDHASATARSRRRLELLSILAGEVRMTPQEAAICDGIRRLGYKRDSTVQLYGNTYDVLADPVCIGARLVFIEAQDRKSGLRIRVRIPLSIVNMVQRSHYPDAA